MASVGRHILTYHCIILRAWRFLTLHHLSLIDILRIRDTGGLSQRRGRFGDGCLLSSQVWRLHIATAALWVILYMRSCWAIWDPLSLEKENNFSLHVSLHSRICEFMQIDSHQFPNDWYFIRRLHMWGGGPVRVFLHKGFVELQIPSFSQLDWKRKNWRDRIWDRLLVFHQLQLPLRLYSVAVCLHWTLGLRIR